MNGTDALLILSLLAVALLGLRLLPTDPPKPQRTPEHVIAGRRARIRRNAGGREVL